MVDFVPDHQISALFERLKSGDRTALAKAITIVESTHQKDGSSRLQLLSEAASLSVDSVRFAITGAPGVGKSTLVEQVGLSLIEEGHKVAVLAIDPTSQKTGGSILGDKTRMPKLSTHQAAFVRPSPTSGVLGGIGPSTSEIVLLCEAAGYDRILIETVGVGQSELAVSNVTDLVCFVTLAGGGDSLQGIKRGILEIVDLVAINKADGTNISASEQYAVQLESALHLLNGGAVSPKALLTSALAGTGILPLLHEMNRLISEKKKNGSFEDQRRSQRQVRFEKATLQAFHQHVLAAASSQELNANLLEQVKNNEVVPPVAAQRLVKHWLNNAS